MVKMKGFRQPIQIDDEKCEKCYTCIETCPNNCLRVDKGYIIHNYVMCAKCEVCMDVCPNNALKVVLE